MRRTEWLQETRMLRFEEAAGRVDGEAADAEGGGGAVAEGCPQTFVPLHPRRSRPAAQHPGSPRRRGIRGTRRWRPVRSGARPEATQHAGLVRFRPAARLLAVPDRDGLDGGRRHAQEAQRFGTPSQHRRRYEYADRFRGEEVHRRRRAPRRSADAELQSVGTCNRVRHGHRRATDARLADCRLAALAARSTGC